MQAEELEGELERLHPAGFAWALGCCHRNREEAEDVLQASYLKVLEAKARFDGHSTFKTFLFSVIRRTAAEHRRRDFLRDLRTRRAFAARPSIVGEARELEDSERRLLLLPALARLSRRQREVVTLVFGHGMTLQEASEAMGVSLGSARVHYQRGKKRLLASLAGERA